jgi:hypothetical protein
MHSVAHPQAQANEDLHRTPTRLPTPEGSHESLTDTHSHPSQRGSTPYSNALSNPGLKGVATHSHTLTHSLAHSSQRGSTPYTNALANLEGSHGPQTAILLMRCSLRPARVTQEPLRSRRSARSTNLRAHTSECMHHRPRWPSTDAASVDRQVRHPLALPHYRPLSLPGWAWAWRGPTRPPSALTLRTGAARASKREKR